MKTKAIALVSMLLAAFALSFNVADFVEAMKLDVANSTIKWRGTKVTGEHYGKIQLKDGELEMKKDKLVGGSFTVDMSTMTCDDLDAGEWNDKLIGHLKSDDFFGVEKYPTATFVITKAKAKGNDMYDITGDMTIKGKTETVMFPATVKMDGDAVTATAKITLDRTKYDIRYGSASFFDNLGDKAIGNDFFLEVELTAKK
ncbi:YceI family protein [Algivirga pacifica]|uniref:YceI family protein n=1 Tax=Algivirga pacifica TaxID=1162670 RepID=A0ABP9DAV7_9BACT